LTSPGRSISGSISELSTRHQRPVRDPETQQECGSGGTDLRYQCEADAPVSVDYREICHGITQLREWLGPRHPQCQRLRRHRRPGAQPLHRLSTAMQLPGGLVILSPRLSYRPNRSVA
jgi:hypothetical protein